MEVSKTVIQMLQNSNHVAIFVHVNPDGDCLGSASALKEALIQIEKTADIYCDDEVSSNYDFIPHINLVNKPSSKNYDLAVAVDCSDLNRLGQFSKLFNTIGRSIKIDHHKTQDDFAEVNIVEQVSSACLILYYYILELTEINQNIACALYAGISSDTGCFMHSNTTFLEHQISGELLKQNFDLEKANYFLFKRRTLNQTMLSKRAYNSIKFLQNGKLAIIALTENDFVSTNTNRGDTMGITDIVVNIEGVYMGVVISEERKGLFSCSFRSSGMVDVSLVAAQFGGGGHARAAGCNIFGHIGTVISKIETEFNIQMNKILKAKK